MSAVARGQFGASCKPAPIFPALGRTAPAAPESLVSQTPASGRRPAELDDPDWLRARYARDGDMAIALDLHVSRKTVRLARERLGIPSLPPGRRPAATVTSVRVPQVKPRIVKITERRNHDKQTGEIPSRDRVLAQLVEWDQALKARNPAAQIGALEALAAAAWNLADQVEQAQAA